MRAFGAWLFSIGVAGQAASLVTLLFLVEQWNRRAPRQADYSSGNTFPEKAFSTFLYLNAHDHAIALLLKQVMFASAFLWITGALLKRPYRADTKD